METVLWLVFLLGMFGIYIHPSARALKIGHDHAYVIVLINLVLGWLVIPWIIAVWWVYRAPKTRVFPNTKVCTYCFEQVHPLATVCEHCRSRLM